jgi:hypothetical protein
MTVTRAFVIIIASAVGFALAGGFIGFLVAEIAPNHYRNLYRNGYDPRFDPREMGVGLGITQGVAAGVVIGAIVVLAVSWHASRHQRVKLELPPEEALRLTEASGRAGRQEIIEGRSRIKE